MALFGKNEARTISRVKLLGIRTAEQTKVLATYNSTLYCFLVEYDNGDRAILEYHAGDKEIKELLYMIDMD